MKSINADYVTVLIHSSIRIDGEKVVYFDPFQMIPEPHDADIICITHGHYDHFSPEDIQKVRNENTILVYPKALSSRIDKLGIPSEHQIPVDPAGQYTVEGVAIETVPAYNIIKPFHPKRNGWVGYIITMNGIRYYVAGDTDCTAEARAVCCDIAMVPVGGVYTMNVNKAVELIRHIQPKIAIPIHYGSVVGKAELGEQFVRNIPSPTAAAIKMLK